MPKKRSLADELAELLNPAPTKEFDPDADVFGAGPTLEESDDELAAEAPRRRGKEAGRLRGDISMEGKEYAGRRSSRAALFGEEEEADEEEEEGSEEDGEGGSGSEDEAAGQGEGWLNGAAGGSISEDDDEAPEEAAAGSGGAARRAARPAAPAGSESEEEGEGAAGGSDDEELGGGAAAVAAAAAAEDAEMAALEREYAAMQADEAAAVAGLRERAARERRKALAVQAQKTVWQRGLEARILLQRALGGANRLPQGAMQAVAAESSPDIAAAFSGLAADASGLLSDLLSLLGALSAQNPAIAEAAAAAGGADGQAAAEAAAEGQQEQEQGSEALWERLDAAYVSFAPFRDAAIDRWHRKTTLTSGGATLRGGQLKALNQSVSTQVAQLMTDPGRVLQRTRVPRSAQQQPRSRLLCPDPEGPQPAKRGRWAEDDGDEEEAAAGVAAAAGSGLEEERDPETFDDTEFYQTLLREFLEGSAEGGGGNWHTGPKQRKAVDRRASKGRKLRYHVHPKLVNFMAPVELQAPQYAAQLFSNLFGGGGGGRRALAPAAAIAAAK